MCALRARAELELKKMAERQKEQMLNKLKSNELELEKARDAIKLRREKVLLAGAQKDVKAQDEARSREDIMRRAEEAAIQLQQSAANVTAEQPAEEDWCIDDEKQPSAEADDDTQSPNMAAAEHTSEEVACSFADVPL
jgi:predicted ribosome quality control (RQC) complex YloA/Tae2 family protein